jgi:hypothetical protein
MRRTDRPATDITKFAASQVSDMRRAEITNAVGRQQDARDISKASAVVANSPGFKKKGSIASPMGPLGTSTNSDRMAPEVFSPLFLLANLNLPRDRVTMNAWNRIYYDTNPIVRNSINLHASYPISKINIACKNKKVQQFFLEWAEKVDLYSIVYGVALEYWKLGEAFPYAELDQTSGTWKRITILNPDYVHVKRSVIGDQTIVSLRPDATLQRLVGSTDPGDLAMKSRLPPHIVDYVRRGQNIPLDNFNVSHLKLLSAPYDIRGTSIVVSVYKDLMLLDKIREAKFAQADGMINPLTLVKLGGEEYKPTQADLEAFRQVLEEAQYDKDFKIVTHNGVDITRVGFSGSTLEVQSDLEFIMNNLYNGLMAPKALFDSEGASYASSSVGLEVLRQRYDIFRNMLKKWLERKIFAPICELQDFFEYVDGEKRLQVPTIDFNHMNLYDLSDYINAINTYVGNKQISVQTLCRSLGLSYEEEQKRLREESINEAIINKEKAILGGMRLSELLSLDPDKAIPEPPEEVAPAESPEGGGEAPPGLPGLSEPPGGGAPPMGG